MRGVIVFTTLIMIVALIAIVSIEPVVGKKGFGKPVRGVFGLRPKFGQKSSFNPQKRPSFQKRKNEPRTVSLKTPKQSSLKKAPKPFSSARKINSKQNSHKKNANRSKPKNGQRGKRQNSKQQRSKSNLKKNGLNKKNASKKNGKKKQHSKKQNQHKKPGHKQPKSGKKVNSNKKGKKANSNKKNKHNKKSPNKKPKKDKKGKKKKDNNKKKSKKDKNKKKSKKDKKDKKKKDKNKNKGKKDKRDGKKDKKKDKKEKKKDKKDKKKDKKNKDKGNKKDGHKKKNKKDKNPKGPKNPSTGGSSPASPTDSASNQPQNDAPAPSTDQPAANPETSQNNDTPAPSSEDTPQDNQPTPEENNTDTASSQDVPIPQEESNDSQPSQPDIPSENPEQEVNNDSQEANAEQPVSQEEAPNLAETDTPQTDAPQSEDQDQSSEQEQQPQSSVQLLQPPLERCSKGESITVYDDKGEETSEKFDDNKPVKLWAKNSNSLFKIGYNRWLKGSNLKMKCAAESPSSSSSSQNGQLSAKWKAFLDTIAFAEGTNKPNGYNIIYTYATFSSFKDHPRQIKCSGGLCSDAAGRYQFLSTTWDGVAKALNLKDFSPKNQDLGAVELVKRRGAYNDVENGRIQAAVEKCSYEWASFPPGRYGQPVKTMSQMLQEYQRNLKKYSSSSSSTTTTSNTNNGNKKENTKPATTTTTPSSSCTTSKCILDVPYLSQHDNPAGSGGAYSGNTCQLTALCMLVNYFAKSKKCIPSQHYKDRQYAKSPEGVANMAKEMLGYGWYTRSGTFDKIKQIIRLGYPIVINTYFTSGHVVVISGYDESGFYFNDPNGQWRSGSYLNHSTAKNWKISYAQLNRRLGDSSNNDDLWLATGSKSPITIPFGSKV